MRCICYGRNKFDPLLFQEVENDITCGYGNVKPNGGLYSSPIGTKWNWHDWCIKEGYRTGMLNESFTFETKDNARILTIDSHDIVIKLPVVNALSVAWISLDFEALKEKYDAILILMSKDPRLYFDLYGWDVDTFFVMNPEIIEICDD